MKKIILTLAFALTAALTAQAQPVYSNIVGMVKQDLPENGFKIVALQFPETATGVTLGNAFTGLSDESVLFVWNTNNTYTRYTYYDGFGWYQGATESNDVEIVKGAALWLRDGGSGSSPIHTGTVPEQASIDVNIVVGFNLISNPYPVNLRIGDIDTSGLTENDVIFVWNGSSYTRYTYYAGFGWYQGATESNDIEIPAGQGFWLRSESAGSLTFTKPY
jgi:hypothetical protein